ncbi:hypothetical protein HU200_029918 [Digitaria exilis]|uniref:BRCT domain-containing protein n=1 Tax=Digitaria exilis TaxID=1010633 RepID=A0A835BS07_9POAL|nr:hypothetical protein HU200_029918 [Digitaria exilis]
MASAASALDGWRRPESFYERSVAFMSGDPSQEHQSATINAAGYSGFILHLSGDEETAASTPISSNVLPFSLHLSSESAAESSPAEHNDNTQVPNYGTPKVPSEGSFLDGQEQEVNFVCQNQFEAKDPQPDNQTGVCKVTGKAISMQFDANKHKRHDVSGGKVDVRKLRNADVNDAIELSIAASEAMVIAEMILDDSQSDKLAAAAIEAALHVKEARKQFYCEETEHACGSSENDLDETDWLAELDEAEMVDVFQDVGLPLVHVSCSSQANQSAGVLPNESTPCPDFVKQAALGKTFSCSRNKKTVLQASTENNAALHGALGALVTCQSIHKEVGRVAAQMNAGTKKHVKGLFEKETSFISESVSVNECCATSRASSLEIVASSRASFYCRTEGLHEETHHTETEELCCQVVCSSLPHVDVDPLCSFVPCSISCDEGISSQAPVCKQNEGHEVPNSQAPLCKKSEGNEGPTTLGPEHQHSKGEEKEFMYPTESPRMQDLDGEAGAGGRIEKKLETREYIDYKEAILQGVDFMLTGFPNQKEKEIESLIRKCGGYVLSKVPPFPLDKTNSIAESSSWKPPIVLSPKKVSTAKFLYGCAINAWVLNPNWFFDSLQAGVLLPPGK